MPYSPPRWLESLGDALLPPASADHVLGDLAESSPSNPAYLRNLVSISCDWMRITALVALHLSVIPHVAGDAAVPPPGSCFLLYEVGVGEVRRSPSAICSTRLLPASTFKVPHALAALDAGVVTGSDTTFAYDGSPQSFESWRRDHTLASAMRHSVVWYYQRIAEKLGATREREYLRKFDYGNADPTSGLTTFWLGGSLQISPEEQLRFLRRLYADELPVSRTAMRTVRELIVQPEGRVVNAAGEHQFGSPWPPQTIVSAKTGSGTDRGGHMVRWLVGHVARKPRSWIFVSCVAGGSDTPALAAVDLAVSALREADILR